MAPPLLGASCSKKRRAGGLAEEGQGEVAAAEEEEDRISALPEDLRLRILALLPLNSAIRTRALLASLERRGRRRLDRFALTLHFGDYGSPKPHRYLGNKDIHRCLDYAAACDVEDLHIDIADHFLSMGSMLSFPSGFSRLVRLSLLRVGTVSFGYSFGSDAFPALEIIHLHYAHSFIDDQGAIDVSPARGHLWSLTIAECNYITDIHAGRASGLPSFRLSSALLPTYDIPSTAPLEDLYICLRGHNYNPIKQWIKELPHLTNLTVLTICSIALRSLQLLMFAMASTNLAHIYMFLKTCQCPQLERLFVQLPTSSRDTSVGNSSKVARKDEPAGVFDEDEPDEELSEEDETDGGLSEEDETEKELLEEERVQEYMLKERLYYEDVYYEEDTLDENVPQEEQSEEDVPGYGLNNLMTAKMMKFKGHYFEMRLVSFLLRKAPVLKKLLLVAPKGHIKALGKGTFNISHFIEPKLLRSRKASPDAQVILSETDFAENQPVHSDVFASF
ncbi:hypothetical protein SETIT_4G256900v2 [Setaria italica]|uniref:FBD domain-containing protein n=1 Tax=Setaria italica TaxID=4555 RepID=A0A368QYC0_SETIT|nr:hypothetical protein SETIT_4G256900v2 [Setaria italica]